MVLTLQVCRIQELPLLPALPFQRNLEETQTDLSQSPNKGNDFLVEVCEQDLYIVPIGRVPIDPSEGKLSRLQN